MGAQLSAEEPAPVRRLGRHSDEEMSDTAVLLGGYVVFGAAAWSAWQLATRNEIQNTGDLALAALAALLGAIFGGVFGVGLMGAGLVVGEEFAKTRRRWSDWIRDRRYVAAGAFLLALAGVLVVLGLLLRAFPSRLVPAALLLFFGGWTVLLAVKRCEDSERWVVRHLPDLPGVALVVLVVEQLVSGDLLTTAPVAGAFFPPAIWLSWRGWRRLKDATRPVVRAAADIVLSVELGLVLVLFTVWLANALSFSPAQVAALRSVLARIHGMAEVHWLYWLVAYTLLALGSYAALRRPDQVARIRQRLRPARLSNVRLPLGAAVNFGRRFLTGLNIALMVALLFPVVLAPVSEGTWRKPVEQRYALEVERRQHAEGAAEAYRQIHRYVTTHPRAAAPLREMVVAVNRVAPTRPGEPVNETALGTARQVGRYQADTLDLDDPALPRTADAPEAEDLVEQLEQLEEGQQRTGQREEQAERFAELAALAITRTFDIPDLGDNAAVQIVKEYLGGLVEDGPVKKLFLRLTQRGGPAPPDSDRLVGLDLERLASAAYDGAEAAVERADADALAFYGRFGFGFTEEATMTRVAELANQHRYLRQGTGACSGCVRGGGGVGGSGGGGGRR